MAHTSGTPNYNFPIITDADRATWIGDFNEAMNKIDTSLFDVDESTGESINAINVAILNLRSALDDVYTKGETDDAISTAVVAAIAGIEATLSDYVKTSTFNSAINDVTTRRYAEALSSSTITAPGNGWNLVNDMSPVTETSGDMVVVGSGIRIVTPGMYLVQARSNSIPGESLIVRAALSFNSVSPTGTLPYSVGYDVGGISGAVDVPLAPSWVVPVDSPSIVNLYVRGNPGAQFHTNRLSAVRLSR